MTAEETQFLRELRQLLRKHEVNLVHNWQPASCGYSHQSYWMQGLEIELSMETLSEELKHPEE